MIRNLIIVSLFTLLILLNACNTITGTIEGTTRGVVRDVRTIHHYTTCIFTDTQCGDLDLKSKQISAYTMRTKLNLVK